MRIGQALRLVYSKHVFSKHCILEYRKVTGRADYGKWEKSNVLVHAHIEDAASCGHCYTPRCV